VTGLEAIEAELPPPRLDHVRRLTDDTGILQHALYTVPDPHHGYTTDDNARALLAVVQYHQLTDDPEAAELAWRYLAFLRYAQREDGHFRNFLAYNRTWLEECGSEDSHGRTAWALGYTVANAPSPGIRDGAFTLFERLLRVLDSLQSPRAQAFSLLGLSWVARTSDGQEKVLALSRAFADRLVSLWDATADDEWQWFEDYITYSNARLCEALLHAYVTCETKEYLEVGLSSLEFLSSVCFVGDMLDIVGNNGWYHRGGKRALFDQQPVDALAMTQACLSAYQITREERFLDRALSAYRWFLGHNRLGAALYDPTTGGCYDGLHPDRVNGNQGAESTLAHLLARLAFEVPTIPPVRTLAAVEGRA